MNKPTRQDDSAEARVRELGLEIPDYGSAAYQGPKYGSMKSHHQVGSLLFLSGHVPELPDGTRFHTGHVGQDVTIEEAYEAARIAGLNVLAGIRAAVGDLDQVAHIVRTLNFVSCGPDFYDVNRVASGATDLYVEVFGKERGLGGRATVGVTSLTTNHCFETWATIEVFHD